MTEDADTDVGSFAEAVCDEEWTELFHCASDNDIHAELFCDHVANDRPYHWALGFREGTEQVYSELADKITE